MGWRRLPANGTQTNQKNVPVTKCALKTTINEQSKKLSTQLTQLKKLIAWEL